jgi:hypothetical protein
MSFQLPKCIFKIFEKKKTFPHKIPGTALDFFFLALKKKTIKFKKFNLANYSVK